MFREMKARKVFLEVSYDDFFDAAILLQEYHKSYAFDELM
jgi:hypothetical protein